MKTRRPRRPGTAGFTMVEVMIAVLLTAIAMVGLIALYNSETRASGTSRHAMEATVLAQDQLERLRTEPVVAGTLSQANINETNTGTGIFTRSWTVTPAASWTDLTVTVSWTEDAITRTVAVYGRRN